MSTKLFIMIFTQICVFLQYLVPFLLNQAGSLLFYLTLASTGQLLLLFLGWISGIFGRISSVGRWLGQTPSSCFGIIRNKSNFCTWNLHFRAVPGGATLQLPGFGCDLGDRENPGRGHWWEKWVPLPAFPQEISFDLIYMVWFIWFDL